MENNKRAENTEGNVPDAVAIQKLAREALRARENAYCPYSGFAVGAALLCADGSVWRGCNIENAAFTPGCCAERTAIFKAVSEGHRDFIALAVAGGKKEAEKLEPCPPCGVCRQVMREFCSGKFQVILAVSETDYKVCTLEELLPKSFGPSLVR